MIYKIDNRESKRITCLRAFCLVLVVFLHQYAGDTGIPNASGVVPDNEVLAGVQYIISRIVTFSAVPLFYLLSSVLLFSKEFTWSGNIKKKLKTLIVPYFLWITLYILAYFVGQTLPLTKIYFANSGRMIREMSAIDFLGAYVGYVGNGLFVNALWFLKELIILNLLASAIKQLVDKFPRFIFFIIVLLWVFDGTPIYFGLNNQSICFFILGYYVVKYNMRMSTLDKIPVVEIILIYGISISLEYYYYLTGNDLRAPARSFTTVIGIVLLIQMSGKICRAADTKIPEWIQTIATYSFFVYASHDFVQTMIKKISSNLLVQSDFVQLFEYFLTPIFTCAICIFVGAIIQKYAPALYSLLSGSRISLGLKNSH